MKIEVNMFARIKNNKGYAVVGKVYNINDFREPSMKYCIDIQAEDFIFVSEEMIVNASHNIIDLIEAGDFVNGEKVVETCSSGKYKAVCINTYYKNRRTKLYLENEDIKSILTREQIEANIYKVGEE